MRIELHAVSKGRGGLALPESTLAFESGEAALAVAETEQRPTVLGLIASGRMRPDAGAVLVDGRDDTAALRRRIALVDAPGVCDPAPNVTVAGITGEELMFAGLLATPLAARRWLDSHGFGDVAATPIADVQPSRRVRLLLELAVLRAGVEGLVLVSPDRHGGTPADWWSVVEEFAARGFAVLVVAGAASAAVLAGRAWPAAVQPATIPDSPPHPATTPDPARHPEHTLRLNDPADAEAGPGTQIQPEPVPPIAPDTQPEPVPPQAAPVPDLAAQAEHALRLNDPTDPESSPVPQIQPEPVPPVAPDTQPEPVPPVAPETPPQPTLAPDPAPPSDDAEEAAR